MVSRILALGVSGSKAVVQLGLHVSIIYNSDFQNGFRDAGFGLSELFSELLPRRFYLL
jgi:hypothetical protein